MTDSYKKINILRKAIEEALWALMGKEYDPDRFDVAIEVCEKALKATSPKRTAKRKVS